MCVCGHSHILLLIHIAYWAPTVYGCQSCLWSTEQEVSVSPFAPEILASRDRFICPVPRQHALSSNPGGLILVLVLVFTHGCQFFPPLYLFIPSTAIGSVPSSSAHALAHRWRSTPRVHPHRAGSPQGSPQGTSSNACC